MARCFVAYGAVVVFVFSAGCNNGNGVITDVDELTRLECEQYLECYPEYFYSDFDALQDCIDHEISEVGDRIEYYEEYGTAACHQSALEFFSCLLQLSCPELYEYYEGAGTIYPCWEEQDKMSRLCD